MLEKNEKKRDRGKPPAAESRRLKDKAAAWVIEQCTADKSASEPFLLCDLLAKAIRVDRKTALKLLNWFKTVGMAMTAINNGYRVGGTYFSRQQTFNRGLKDEIAERVNEMVPSGVNIACGGGTTVASSALYMIQQNKQPMIHTNNKALLDMAPKDITSTGGKFAEQINAYVGPAAERYFESTHCEFCLLSFSGITKDGLLYVSEAQECAIAERILRSTTETAIIVADVTKFTRTDAHEAADLKKHARDNPKRPIRIVTNAVAELKDPEQRQQARSVLNALERIKGVQIIPPG